MLCSDTDTIERVPANAMFIFIGALPQTDWLDGVVARDGGYTARVADACVIVSAFTVGMITPHAEAFQAVIWHLLVSHPSLKANQTKWESVGR